MKNHSRLFFTLSWFLGLSFAFAENEDALAGSAEEKLKAEQNTVVFLAKGMGCQACASAVQDELVKLAFVDQSRLDEGMKFDVESKLVTVAITPGEKVDLNQLSSAIEDAGYDPLRIYQILEGALKTSDLPKEAKSES